MSQYWQSLSNLLTKLKIVFCEDVNLGTCSALSQLTQLQSLEVGGVPRTNNAAAAFHLQLPQLRRLTLQRFGNTTISLECPQLRSLRLFKLDPLHTMSVLPEGVEKLQLVELGAGSVPIDRMLPEQGLKHLFRLQLEECPGQPSAIREACNASKLTVFQGDQAWAPLLLSQPPWQGLPHSLQDLALSLPLDEGIPLVLEQFTKLRSLRLYHVGKHLMYLTRPLDPFFNMPSFSRLLLCGNLGQQGDSSRWTPAALGLLGLADRRVLRMQSLPGGRAIWLSY